MSKTNSLNGLPNNLAKSFLGTLSYYKGGYMADWLVYVSKEEGVTSIELDVLNETISPEIDLKKPLLVHLNRLKNIISTELLNHGFDKSHIVKATLRFEIFPARNYVKCYPSIEDVNGKVYQIKKTIIETAYEVDFKTQKNFFKKLISFFYFN
jgi:hypothetical protein